MKTEPQEVKELRDEFAMAALIGLFNIKPLSGKDTIAKAAYELADAMIEARSNNKNKS